MTFGAYKKREWLLLNHLSHYATSFDYHHFTHWRIAADELYLPSQSCATLGDSATEAVSWRAVYGSPRRLKSSPFPVTNGDGVLPAEGRWIRSCPHGASSVVY